jgi:hypothetical protein
MIARPSFFGFCSMLWLLGCGGGANEPVPAPARESAESTEGEEVEVLVIGALGSDAEPAAPAATPPDPPPAPHSRNPRGPLSPEPALEAGDRAYARAAGISLDVGVQPTLDALVQALIARLRERVDAITAAQGAYDAVATSARLRSLAAVRMADLYDALGAELGSFPIAMPADLERRIAGTSREVQAEVRDQVTERVREAFANHAADVFCSALTRYRASMADGVEAPRAMSQIDSYGPAFAAHCAE